MLGNRHSLSRVDIAKNSSIILLYILLLLYFYSDLLSHQKLYQTLKNNEMRSEKFFNLICHYPPIIQYSLLYPFATSFNFICSLNKNSLGVDIEGLKKCQKFRFKKILQVI